MSDNWIVAPWDADNPLDAITGETVKANQALRDYAAMGAGRSIAKLIERYRTVPNASPTRREPTLKTWSVKFHWQARLADYIRVQDLEREQQRAERRQQLEDDDWKTGDDLRKVAGAVLALLGRKIDAVAKSGGTIDDLNVTAGQIVQAFKIGSDLQRLSTNEPTANINLSGAALDAAIEAEFRRLADIRHGQQERVIRKSEAVNIGTG
jgi:hypothetical protein